MEASEGSLFFYPCISQSHFIALLQACTGDWEAAVYLFEQSLKHLARADFHNLRSTEFHDAMHALRPPDRCRQLCDQVFSDSPRIGFRLCMDILNYGTPRCLKWSMGDGSCQPFTGGFHQGRVKGSSHGQYECSPSSSLSQ